MSKFNPFGMDDIAKMQKLQQMKAATIFNQNKGNVEAPAPTNNLVEKIEALSRSIEEQNNKIAKLTGQLNKEKEKNKELEKEKEARKTEKETAKLEAARLEKEKNEKLEKEKEARKAEKEAAKLEAAKLEKEKLEELEKEKEAAKLEAAKLEKEKLEELEKEKEVKKAEKEAAKLEAEKIEKEKFEALNQSITDLKTEINTSKLEQKNINNAIVENSILAEVSQNSIKAFMLAINQLFVTPESQGIEVNQMETFVLNYNTYIKGKELAKQLGLDDLADSLESAISQLSKIPEIQGDYESFLQVDNSGEVEHLGETPVSE